MKLIYKVCTVFIWRAKHCVCCVFLPGAKRRTVLRGEWFLWKSVLRDGVGDLRGDVGLFAMLGLIYRGFLGAWCVERVAQLCWVNPGPNLPKIPPSVCIPTPPGWPGPDPWLATYRINIYHKKLSLFLVGGFSCIMALSTKGAWFLKPYKHKHIKLHTHEVNPCVYRWPL